jgi:adenylylsulfate kinase
VIVALAGLPGTGKSTLARRLAVELAGVVLSKDDVRAQLFPPPVLNYSAEQDDLTMAAVYSAATYIRRAFPATPVILDGRTFLRAYQIRDLLALGRTVGEEPRVIECACAQDVVRGRLERDLAAGSHPARNRTFELYLAVKARAEPIAVSHLTLDTGAVPLQECVSRAVAYLRGA